MKHGNGGYRRGCRCDDCRAAHAAYKLDLKERRRRTGRIPRTVKHGTKSTYLNWSCRCRACTAANAAYQAVWKAKAAAGNASTNLPHGNYQRYCNYGCRCRPCTDAWAAYHRDHAARTRGATA